MTAIDSGGAAASAASLCAIEDVSESKETVLNNKDVLAIVRSHLSRKDAHVLEQTCRAQASIARELKAHEFREIGSALGINKPLSVDSAAADLVGSNQLVENLYERTVKDKYHDVMGVMQLCHEDGHAPEGCNVLNPATASTAELYSAYQKVYDESLLILGQEITGLTFSNADEVRAWLNDPANLPQIQAITKLFLPARGMRVLPKEIGIFTNLETLEFSRNKLITLPQEVGQLTNLDDLIVWGNQLSTLPSELGQLPNLSNLEASQNRLVSLPSELGKLPNLSNLDVSQNRLVSLPSEFGHLARLDGLQLHMNPLYSIPLSFLKRRKVFGRLSCQVIGEVFHKGLAKIRHDIRAAKDLPWFDQF